MSRIFVFLPTLVQVGAYMFPTSLWVRVGLGLSVGVGLTFSYLSWTAPAFYLTCLTGFLFWAFYRLPSSLWRLNVGILCFLFGFALMKHWVPGTQNWCVASSLLLSSTSAPWNFWVNFDKPLIGCFIFLFSLRPPRITPWHKTAWIVFYTFSLCALVLMGVAWTSGFVFLDPKLSPFLPLWAITNLFTVTFAEEAFFRLFVQHSLVQWSQRRGFSWVWGWIGASFLFALFHLPAHPLYIGLCGVAGLFYGYAFHKTKSIEASMAVHFLLNLIHFVFWSYPFAQ